MDADEGSCSQTATCEPEGLLMFLSWSQGEGWPSQPTEVHVHHPALTGPTVIDCAAGAGALECAPRCTAGTLREGRCVRALPLAGAADPMYGDVRARHLEIWVEVEDARPVVRALEVIAQDLRDARLFPRTLDLSFHDDGAVWTWSFSPPNVHIEASATGTLACPVKVCDGRFVSVQVSALDPAT